MLVMLYWGSWRCVWAPPFWDGSTKSVCGDLKPPRVVLVSPTSAVMGSKVQNPQRSLQTPPTSLLALRMSVSDTRVLGVAACPALTPGRTFPIIFYPVPL